MVGTVAQNIASTVHCQNETQIHTDTDTDTDTDTHTHTQTHSHTNWLEVTDDTQSAQIL